MYDEKNKPGYLLQGYRLVGYSDKFFVVTQRGDILYTFDEKGHRLGSMHVTDNAQFVGCAGNTFTMRSAHTIRSYDQSCKQISSRAL